MNKIIVIGFVLLIFFTGCDLIVPNQLHDKPVYMGTMIGKPGSEFECAQLIINRDHEYFFTSADFFCSGSAQMINVFRCKLFDSRTSAGQPMFHSILKTNIDQAWLYWNDIDENGNAITLDIL